MIRGRTERMLNEQQQTKHRTPPPGWSPLGGGWGTTVVVGARAALTDGELRNGNGGFFLEPQPHIVRETKPQQNSDE